MFSSFDFPQKQAALLLAAGFVANGAGRVDERLEKFE